MCQLFTEAFCLSFLALRSLRLRDNVVSVCLTCLSVCLPVCPSFCACFQRVDVWTVPSIMQRVTGFGGGDDSVLSLLAVLDESGEESPEDVKEVTFPRVYAHTAVARCV